MSEYLEKLDPRTRDVINYLKSRNEVCHLSIQEIEPAVASQIFDWENKNLCTLPNELKDFYLSRNGMLVEWKVKVDNESTVPLGRIQINGIQDLTRVGTALSKDYREPSLYDLEDLQEELTTLTSTTTKGQHHKEALPPVVDEAQEADDSAVPPTVVTVEDVKVLDRQSMVPHFNDSSRNFELDNCLGYGKVCLVYRNAKPGLTCSADAVEFWFLDRSLHWHFLTKSFAQYYVLLIAHLGLPQWQMLFTQDGLPPFFYQWYHLFAPGRLMIHDDTWKSQEYWSLLEMPLPASIATTTTTAATVKKTQQQQQQQQQQQHYEQKKIDFVKLFQEDKADSKSKAKAQTTATADTNVSSSTSGSNIPNTSTHEKAKAYRLKQQQLQPPTMKK